MYSYLRTKRPADAERRFQEEEAEEEPSAELMRELVPEGGR
jgi:hypothetical protein